MTAVLGAMDGEIAAFLKHTEERSEERWKGFTFHRGRIEGREVVIAKSGVGKVMAAMVTQKLIDRFDPACIIFTGLAGGLTACTDIGDTVIAKDCMQHDLDASAFGFKRGEVPLSRYRILKSDARMVSIASGHLPVTGKIVIGRILTGDQFLTHAALSSHRYLVDELHGDAVEMEGASVGLVATVNEVPFVIIRTISDKVDGHARVNFPKILLQASLNSYRFVSHLLRNM